MDAGRQDPSGDGDADLPSRANSPRIGPENAEDRRMADRITARSEALRGIILFLVVLTTVVAAFWAMINETDTKDFAAYMAPVTGLAGTIVGYWFGQRTDRRH
jgi:hypothetical protein